MRKLLPFFILFLSLSAGAQNWNIITPGINRYFTNGFHYLHGMRIDSVINTGTDLHYYPYRSLRQGGWVAPSGSWLGERIVRKSDGTHLFFNKWNDTIVIKSKANVGESWVFYSDSSDVYYNAEVTALDTMTILGSLDSVRRIAISVFDGNTQLTADSFNSAEIILSKQHGAYTITDMYSFPYHDPDTNILLGWDAFFRYTQYQVTVPYILNFGQLPAPGPLNCIFKLVDFVNPTYAQLNDWNVGDIFQRERCWVGSGSVSGCGGGTYFLDTVVSKNVTFYGVEYLLKGWTAGRHSQGSNGQYYVMSPSQRTLFFSNSEHLFPDNFIPEAVDSSDIWRQYFYHYFPSDTSNCSTGQMYYKSWDGSGISWVQYFESYKKGIGLLRLNDFDASQGATVSDSSIIYMVRNGVACGAFVLPDTSIPVNASALAPVVQTVKVYPNPASGYLQIDASFDNYDISLYNALGQQVIHKSVTQSRLSIDLSQLPQGMYHLQVTVKDGVVLHHKIVHN
ncbi:MAG: T9SS type A sorting domain-containing protein [Flavipsychrobacter sp.]|nr:T9SS type A sorting domain-containing protein [Flavipsychrobacter sp.]